MKTKPMTAKSEPQDIELFGSCGNLGGVTSTEIVNCILDVVLGPCPLKDFGFGHSIPEDMRNMFNKRLNKVASDVSSSGVSIQTTVSHVNDINVTL